MARLILLILVLHGAFAVGAQAQPRDYAITLDGVSYTAEAALVSITVANLGGDALAASEIVISEYQSGRALARQPLPALATGVAQTFTLPLSRADLPADNVSIQIQAGIDEFELEGSPIARNNRQLFVINPQEAGLPAGTSPASTSAQTFDLYIPLVNLGLNFGAGGIEVNGRSYSQRDLLDLRRDSAGGALLPLAVELDSALDFPPAAQV